MAFYTTHHYIAFLRSLADKRGHRQFGVWPRDDRKDRAFFTRMRDACVKARYRKHYVTSRQTILNG
ncbi:hypothetical protein [Sphingobium sp. WCS2017Hpa-17]|uniref:hypothetical protein n=1 Tax=Sphingobium sp. WCS2017Hpa-17 TaxID=3073638 RepID=UPI0028893F7D|nr:hypothetical protein [Sphingobium sp. WCS2017Hpa-17]